MKKVMRPLGQEVLECWATAAFHQKVRPRNICDPNDPSRNRIIKHALVDGVVRLDVLGWQPTRRFKKLQRMRKLPTFRYKQGLIGEGRQPQCLSFLKRIPSKTHIIMLLQCTI